MASDWPRTFLQPGCFCLALLFTRDGECHDTTRGITRGGLIPRVVVIASTYIDSRQKSTGISYLAYGYTGNCITRGMIILYFQLTLYIAGIATGIVRSQLRTTPVRAARADLSTKWSCSI